MEAAARHERVGVRIIRKYLHWNTSSSMVIGVRKIIIIVIIIRKRTAQTYTRALNTKEFSFCHH